VTYTFNGSAAGSGAKSNTEGPLAAGNYTFQASFAGDANYVSAVSPNEPLAIAATAQIAPTGTTAAQFATGSSSTLAAVFYTKTGGGKIAQGINPGVFFYFSFVTAPAAGGTIKVIETPPSTPPGAFLIQGTSTGNLALYDATGNTVIEGGTDLGKGNVSFATSSLTPGKTYIIAVKYNTKSIVGQTAPSTNPATFSFATQVNGSTTASASVQLKLSGTQLAPSAGNGIGVASLTEQQLLPVVDAALARWQAAGLSAAQLSTLRNTPIYIADFLDAPRLGVESDGQIWLNASAAGWGWFTDPGLGAAVTAGRIDLLTVVEHEFGHVLLGYQDGTRLMAATVQPGTRILASASDLGLAAQPPAAPANSAPTASLVPTTTRATDIAAAVT
jgi:hypothetical protein